eukprot:6186105-Karenia_brevis.AAC.1
MASTEIKDERMEPQISSKWKVYPHENLVFLDELAANKMVITHIVTGERVELPHGQWLEEFDPEGYGAV